ncbi:hypothetical protein EGI31_22370 [Lacihabitans soyangensis]|uniref:Uncharacterized protein n=1 Tax=Lacihabitans soyangensis TaxID=869394 RepID=A0AAE3H929_9BACT|nr:hypothetical protein [Lacihabitans soyangensis]
MRWVKIIASVRNFGKLNREIKLIIEDLLEPWSKNFKLISLLIIAIMVYFSKDSYIIWWYAPLPILERLNKIKDP